MMPAKGSLFCELFHMSNADCVRRYYSRVYLKTENVTGSEEFSRCARHFFAGILTYFKEK